MAHTADDDTVFAGTLELTSGNPRAHLMAKSAEIIRFMFLELSSIRNLFFLSFLGLIAIRNALGNRYFQIQTPKS